MVDTSQLIEKLSKQAAPVKPLRPWRYAALLLGVLLTYAACVQCWRAGIRPDLALQLARPMFVVELGLLSLTLVSSVIASAHAMLPDMAQRQYLLKVPYALSSGILVLMLFQLSLPQDSRMVTPEEVVHTYQCTLYIAISALLPAMFVFYLIRKGASVVPMHAGALAVMASVSVSAITLRLSEANDDIVHLLSWHYIPSLCFAALGTVFGRVLLRW